MLELSPQEPLLGVGMEAFPEALSQHLLACFSRGIFNESAQRSVRKPCYFPSCVVSTPIATFLPDVNKQTDLIRKLNLNNPFFFSSFRGVKKVYLIRKMIKTYLENHSLCCIQTKLVSYSGQNLSRTENHCWRRSARSS